MTAIAATRAPRVLALGSERSLGTLKDRMRAVWDKHRAFRTSIAELSALTDRQLADVGISRPAIRRHAREAIYGK